MTIGIAQTEEYDKQLTEKVDITKKQFLEFYSGPLEVFESSKSNFRMRAEFKIWHEGEKSYYAMYKPGEYKTPVMIDNFSIGSKKIHELMPKVLREINASSTIRNRLFQIEFLTTLTNEALVTFIYHKKLDEEWIDAAKKLEALLQCKIIGRSRKQKVVLSEDFVTETLQLKAGTFNYQHVETGFTQPNAEVCISMLNWAVDKSQGIGGDLLELYCGNGNFTIPLSTCFDKVLATEVSKTSIRSAQYNIEKNNINNIDVLRMSSEEFTEALNGVREYRRLKELDLNSFNFSTIFVDPPRSGLDEDTEKMVSRFDHILYVSCNPETLHKNLQSICKTHKVEAMAMFDQFPYTHHRECGVLLKKY